MLRDEQGFGFDSIFRWLLPLLKASPSEALSVTLMVRPPLVRVSARPLWLGAQLSVNVTVNRSRAAMDQVSLVVASFPNSRYPAYPTLLQFEQHDLPPANGDGLV